MRAVGLAQGDGHGDALVSQYAHVALDHRVRDSARGGHPLLAPAILLASEGKYSHDTCESDAGGFAARVHYHEHTVQSVSGRRDGLHLRLTASKFAAVHVASARPILALPPLPSSLAKPRDAIA
eukprot:scaffold1786_cov398-Prasinococcus_capsulatus_cf.AAC.34